MLLLKSDLHRYLRKIDLRNLAMQLIMLLSVIMCSSAAFAELYKVELLRAAPGQLIGLMKTLEAQPEPRPHWLRHSQGDHWDLMLITPVKDYSTYFKANPKVAVSARNKAIKDLLSWQETVFMHGPDSETIATDFRDNGFYHVEMFRALPGKQQELIKQRHMENDFLERIGKTSNHIFVKDEGSHWDVMTIGFHDSLLAFAQPSDKSAEQQREAAVAAGFESDNRIGSYLRSLIASHHDTLAVRPTTAD